MKWATVIARCLLGFIFFASGISFFFITPPPLEPGPMADFFNGLVATGYFLYLLKITEIVCGFMLLINRFVPLALVILAPIILHIFLVHAILQPPVYMALLLGVLEIYLAFFSKEYSPTIKTLFKPKV